MSIRVGDKSIVQQNKNLVWQIQDASRKGDAVSLAKILEGVSKKTCKVLVNTSDDNGDTPLITCIQSKSLRCLQRLLKAGANPSHRNAKRENFLHIAANLGRPELIKVFLKSVPKDVTKALVNSSDKDGDTPLLCSAYSKSVRGVQLLLKAGANPSHRNAKRENFLHIAANLGRHELIKVFLKSVPKGVTKALINSSDKNGYTPLLSGVCSKSVRGMQLLLKAGANPLRRNAEKQGFLHIVANLGRPELIKVFLKSVPKDVTKALVNSSDKDGDTPLLCSAYSKSVRGVQLLLKAGANPSHRNAKRENFLHIAANLGRHELIKVFLKSVPKGVTKALINSSDKNGYTPLLSGVCSKSVRGMQLLLKAGANPLRRNAEKQGFLHIVAYLGRHELIKVFLKSVPKDVTKALVNSSDKDGDTPLLISAYSKSVRGVQLLLKAGANPSHRNAKRENFLHIAANLGRHELIKVFLKGASKDVTKALANSSDKDGNTPLLNCIRPKSRNTKECVQFLLKAKANPFICGPNAYFPYVEAMENGHPLTASLLAKKDPKQKGTFALLNLQIAFGRELHPILFGKKVNFPGSSRKFWSGYISSTLQKVSIRKKILSRCTQEQCEELQQAFVVSSAKNPPVEAIVQKIRQGKLVIVPAGWKEHGISLVFRDGYLIVCNRGEGCKDKNGKHRTFFIRKISSNLVTEELLKRCLAKENASARKGSEFFYKELPQALNGTEDDFCQRILSIAPKISKANTCGYTSMKAALRASLALITKDPKAARDMAKAWATNHRGSALKMFRETPSPFDKAFRKETIDAMSKRLEKRTEEPQVL